MSDMTAAIPHELPARPRSDVRPWEFGGFFAGNLGNVFFNSLLTAFLLIYLTDVVGIEAAAVGVLLVVARFWDIIVDPVVGYAVDHLRPIAGKRFAYYALIGNILVALTFIALFTLPARTADPLLTVWIIYLVYGVTFVFMDIPMNAMIPAITAQPKARSRLASTKGFAYLLGGVLVSALTVPVVGSFGDAQTGWQAWTIGLGVVSVVLVTIMAFSVKERVLPINPKRYTARDMVGMAVGNRALAVFTLAILFVTMSRTAEQTAVIYFFTYDVGAPALYTLLGAISLPGIILGNFLFPVLATRFGARPTLVSSFLLSTLAFLLIGFLPSSALPAIFTLLGIAAIATGGTISQTYAVQAEIVDDIEHRKGIRAEAAVAAVASLGVKIGLGLGAAVVGFVLSWFGYVANAEQTSESLHGIRVAFSFLPAAIGLIGALVMLLYPISVKTRNQAVQDLEVRRTATIPTMTAADIRRARKDNT